MKLFTFVALLMFLFVLNLYIMKESSTSIKALLPVLFGFLSWDSVTWWGLQPVT